MTRDSDPDKRRQQAADWFSRLGAPQVSSDDIRHFFEWRRDPDNARAYERIEALWSSSRRLADCPSSKHLAQVWRGVNGERASSGVGF